MKNQKSKIPGPGTRSGFTCQMTKIREAGRNPQTKVRRLATAAFCALLSVIGFPFSAFSQGTAFTYQGRLESGGTPANGLYDLQFMLSASPDNSVSLGTLTNAATAISNGLFTVTLDFGAGVFTGTNYWLGVGVRTNGGGAFNLLSPRQPITPHPYAIYAGGVSAAGISSGTLDIARFPTGGSWALNTALQFGTGQAFVGINRDSPVTSSEYFGVHAPVTSGYGGMYVTTEGTNGWPFYGYRAGVSGSETAWTYLDGNTGDWHLNVGGIRLTVTDEGNVGIGNTSPTNRLHVLGFNPNAFTGYFQGSGNGATALVGHNSRGAGTTYGVLGRVDSAAGYAGYFQGGRNYFEGHVGIGTTNPLTALDVSGTVTATSFSGAGGSLTGLNASQLTIGTLPDARLGSTVAFKHQNNAFPVNQSVPAGAAPTPGLSFNGDLDTGLFNPAANTLAVATGGAERLRVNASGNVGIGTGSPANPLSVTGNTDISGQVSIGITGADARLLVRGILGEDAFRVRVEGGTKLLVKDNGGVGIGSNFGDVPADGLRTLGAVGVGRLPTANALEVQGAASKSTAGDWLANSDRRIKQDIEPVTDALDTLNRVRLVSFRYTDQYHQERPAIEDRRYLNVIAQEFAAVFPEHVKSSGEKLPDGSEILQVDTWPVTIYSAAAIQELDRKLQAKEAEIAELNQSVRELKELVQAMNRKLNGGAK